MYIFIYATGTRKNKKLKANNRLPKNIIKGLQSKILMKKPREFFNIKKRKESTSFYVLAQVFEIIH